MAKILTSLSYLGHRLTRTMSTGRFSGSLCTMDRRKFVIASIPAGAKFAQETGPSLVVLLAEINPVFPGMKTVSFQNFEEISV